MRPLRSPIEPAPIEPGKPSLIPPDEPSPRENAVRAVSYHRPKQWVLVERHDPVTAVQKVMVLLPDKIRQEVISGLPVELQNTMLAEIGEELLSRKDPMAIRTISGLATQVEATQDSLLGDDHPLIRALEGRKVNPADSEMMMKSVERYRQRIESEEVTLEAEATQ